ncbi:MAG: YafY family protein [Nocardioides sp.]
MRADRLIAVLMLLQRHESLTAGEVARRLEISERTARRDLDALALAGVPVYSQQGRGGGWSLVGGARTDLSGLTGPEVRALFVAAGALPHQSQTVRQALAKLQRAVPAPFRGEAEKAAEALFVDLPWPTESPPAQLEALHEAISRGFRVELTYRDREERQSRRVIDPLGVVQRADRWYAVSMTDQGRRTFRVDRMLDVKTLAEPVRRPPGFDLAAEWAAIRAEFAETAQSARVHGRARAWACSALLRVWGVKVVSLGPPDEDGWQEIVLAGRSVRSLVGQIAGLAEAMEITSPPEACARLHEIGTHLATAYAPSRDA